MISVVVCSKTGRAATEHQPNVAKTIGAAFEYICIDNTKHTWSLAAAYNKATEKARGEIIVFVHEDAFFMSPNWGAALLSKFAAQPDLALAGVAGTQYLSSCNPVWTNPGRPFIKGRIIHELQNGERFSMNLFSVENGDSEVVAIDGVFMAARASALKNTRFDETTFDGFHFYDLDLCMRLRRNYRIAVTTDVLIKHLSGGSFGREWKNYAQRFLDKYRAELPASCAGQEPDFSNIIPYETVDLKGKVSQKTRR